MKGDKKNTTPYVFGLDIGTRSIVGTVGYRDREQFIVVAQRVKEHDTRAMLDGQIHDIQKVGDTIRMVKQELEEAIGEKLKGVCIAAAGRVLRTVNTHEELTFQVEQEVTKEDVYRLVSSGVEKAYREFLETEKDDSVKFYCVGHSVVRYYLNGYPMGNLEEHKGRSIGVDLIATFLPDDVVDGLYKAVEIAGLEVASLTLEPIAAIQLAIPERFRMLNIALVDVGAGTSDISITNDGCIIAYGMIPVAGDILTETIAKHCLVDFTEAERIKREAGTKESVSYMDIMLLPQTITSAQVNELLHDTIEDMASQVSDKILELNGGKPVSAVFIVGGGGKMAGYAQAVAEHLGIQQERVALRGEEVMQNVVFKEETRKDSLLVTPVGICMNYYEQNNNFIFVSFNGSRIKMYDNSTLTVADVAMQAQFPKNGLFPKRGRELNFYVNGKQRIIRGMPGEAAVVEVNGKPVDLNTTVRENDIIVVTESTAGEPAKAVIGDLPENAESLSVFVNGSKIEIPKFAQVNGVLQSAYYEIAENDRIEMLNYYTVQQIADFMDILLTPDMEIQVNHVAAQTDTPVYENFTVEWGAMAEASWAEQSAAYEAEEAAQQEAADAARQAVPQETAEAAHDQKEGQREQKAATEQETLTGTLRGAEGQSTMTSTTQTTAEAAGQKTDADGSAGVETSAPVSNVPVSIGVMVNKMPVTLSGKPSYVFVDVFDRIDFDLSRPMGKRIVTELNGRPAEYLEEIHNGDVIDVYWSN